MQFSHTLLYVKSVPDTLKFYNEAFGFETKLLHESNAYGELQTGATTLGFVSFDLAEQNNVGFKKPDADHNQKSEICFFSKDITKDLAHAVKNGATVVHDVQKKPWGELVAFVRDINGFVIEICMKI